MYMAKPFARWSYASFRRWAVCVVLIGLYNNWILAPFLNPNISLRASLISEISARTQPHHLVFQSMDVTAGILTLALLPLIGHFVHRIALPLRYLLLATVGFIGFDSIVDALLPISCAPSVDSHCSLIASHSLITSAHMFESTAAGMVLFAAPLLWWWATRRQRAPLEARASLGFAALQIMVGCAIVGAHTTHIEVVGSLQRIYESGIGIWIAVLTSNSMRHQTTRYSLHMLWRRPLEHVSQSPAIAEA